MTARRRMKGCAVFPELRAVFGTSFHHADRIAIPSTSPGPSVTAHCCAMLAAYPPRTSPRRGVRVKCSRQVRTGLGRIGLYPFPFFRNRTVYKD